jgi:hypothetical protein
MEAFNVKAKLESGASRVFNCLQITQEVLAAQDGAVATDLFFRARSLNNMIVIKEPNLDDVAGVHGRSLPVRTKLFLPYNTDVPYEGGESVFTDDVRFVPTLRHLSGGDGVSEQNFELDLLKIKLFEQLPSLDPFLVKDTFVQAKVRVNEAYFRISAADWMNIRDHIGARFAVMCRFAGDGRADAATVDRLVERLWEARNLDPLFPFLSALGLPVERAPEFFYAWKGISYFDYEFTRNVEQLRSFSKWVQTAQTRGPAHRQDRLSIEEDRGILRDRLRKVVGETQEILRSYEESFDLLFNKRQSARKFADFMLESKRHFWTLGSNINGVQHAVAVWSKAVERVIDRTLPPVQMVRLMRTLRQIV